ncbi:MAG: bifunctional (p)ppGpp synthetase/guanosine-3',5'-bis(diphosphate) 3'-pyrophosphohydrolase [Alphaproteobacteria bacterium]|nr:bifunctional (p)ppGpp synthetase/guanosine-3',5'-bis(diphosphate) 3'-pyrophosphohydrolase [Alphaproteobacteria bacterium]
MNNATLLLAKAIDFAAKKHVAQRRKGENQEPYINHVAEVAYLLAEATSGQDTNLIIAGLLHDTIEDTDTSYSELEENFNKEIADLVLEVTDDKSLQKKERKRLQVENAPKKSARAKMLKFADKISNLRSIIQTPPVDWPREQKVEYFEWAKCVTDGCRGVNDNLEKLFDEIYSRGKDI